MWFLSLKDRGRGEFYVVFGRRARTLPRVFFTPAFYKVNGRRPTWYGDYRVYSRGDVAFFLRMEDEVVDEAFAVGGVSGIKRFLFNTDVYDFVADNFGVGKRVIKRVVKWSNAFEFVPYFNVLSKSFFGVVDGRQHMSVETLGVGEVRFYSGSRTYVYRKVGRKKGEVVRDLLRGRVSRGVVEPEVVENEYFVDVLAEAGDWYMFMGSFFALKNNVLIESGWRGMKVIYPRVKKVCLEEALLLLEEGEIMFDML